MWEYYDENKKYEKQQYTDYRRCYCITTNRLFNSALDASSEYGIDAQHIYLACRKNKNTLGGITNYPKLAWKYVD